MLGQLQAALDEYGKVVARCVTRHGGTVVPTHGAVDSLLAVFRTATDAVAAAIDIQQMLMEPSCAEPLLKARLDGRRVLGRFLRQGLDAVPRRSPPGRVVEVTDEWLSELERVIGLDPLRIGMPSAVWMTRLLSGYLERATGHAAAIETVRIYLHRLGDVCKRPTWSLKQTASQQAGWVNNT